MTKPYQCVKKGWGGFREESQSPSLSHFPPIRESVKSVMTCSYCGTRNGEGEQRCRCCGRKPGDTLTGEFPMPRVEGALAAQPQPMLRPPVARPPEPSQVNLRAATQRALPFGDRSSKVIAFDSFVATPVKKSVPSQTRAGSGTAAAAAPARTPSRRAPRVSPDQGSLDFLPAVQAKPRTLGTSVEAVIYCDAPVATTLHRAVAAGLDASMVFIRLRSVSAGVLSCSVANST